MKEQVIPDVGKILFVHQVRRDYFITISAHCQLKLWFVKDCCDWVDKFTYPFCKGTEIRHTSVSYLQSYLALITSDCFVKLYRIIIDDGNLSSEIFKIEPVENYKCVAQPTCTEFSNDVNEKFLAIARSDGKISVRQKF